MAGTDSKSCWIKRWTYWTVSLSVFNLFLSVFPSQLVICCKIKKRNTVIIQRCSRKSRPPVLYTFIIQNTRKFSIHFPFSQSVRNRLKFMCINFYDDIFRIFEVMSNFILGYGFFWTTVYKRNYVCLCVCLYVCMFTKLRWTAGRQMLKFGTNIH